MFMVHTFHQTCNFYKIFIDVFCLFLGRLYAVQKGIKVAPKASASKVYLLSLMDEIEKVNQNKKSLLFSLSLSNYAHKGIIYI